MFRTDSHWWPPDQQIEDRKLHSLINTRASDVIVRILFGLKDVLKARYMYKKCFFLFYRLQLTTLHTLSLVGVPLTLGHGHSVYSFHDVGLEGECLFNRSNHDISTLRGVSWCGRHIQLDSCLHTAEGCMWAVVSALLLNILITVSSMKFM